MIDFRKLMAEQYEWSNTNFGPHPTTHPLLGLIEEIGELCHAHLKGLQGIRHTPTEIRALKIDAVADCVIFLMDYCNQVHIVPVMPTGEEASTRRQLEFLGIASRRAGGMLMDAAGPLELSSPSAFDIQAVLECLFCYCVTEQIDFTAAVNDTWAKVSARKWKNVDPTEHQAQA